jgi:hypothetical protein
MMLLGICTRHWNSNIPAAKYMELYDAQDGIGHQNLNFFAILAFF